MIDGLIMRCLRILSMATMLAAAAAQAHEVQHQTARVEATTVRLTYADGEPFSFEQYELFADDSQRPVQTGRTDANGRVVFLDNEAKRWRLRAFTVDGHGVELQLDGGAGKAGEAAGTVESGRTERLLLGLAVILALFGAVQFAVRRKRGT